MTKHIIYISLLMFIIGTFIVLPFITVPISSSSRGVVRAKQENVPIISMVNGRVIKDNLKENNQLITKGDTLIEVKSDQVSTQKHLQQNQIIGYDAQLSDLSKISKGVFTNLKTKEYQAQVSAMFERMAEVETSLSLAKKDLDRATLLYNQGVISTADYDKIMYHYKGLKKQINSIKKQQVAQWEAQRRETQRNIRMLGSDIERFTKEEENYIVIAPNSGRLVNFSGVQKGSFLMQGQSIGEISSGENLIVECMVSPKDIGFIHKGQSVKFQIDTYNYNQWGLLPGNVIDIDQNIIFNQQTGEAYFKVYCKMDKFYLKLKNGYKAKISKGMTLTARFHLTDRTLWDLLFDRVDDWFNPKLK